jgi:hypothetical protein
MIHHLIIAVAGVGLLLVLWVGVEALARGRRGAEAAEDCEETPHRCGACGRWGDCGHPGR